MTKEEYAVDRDLYVTALAALQRVRESFCELAWSTTPPGDEPPANDAETAVVLDRNGAYLYGDEYLGVMKAIRLMEALVGRAHERSL